MLWKGSYSNKISWYSVKVHILSTRQLRYTLDLTVGITKVFGFRTEKQIAEEIGRPSLEALRPQGLKASRPRGLSLRT